MGHYLRGPSYLDGSARWMEPATLRLPAQGIAGPVCRVLWKAMHRLWLSVEGGDVMMRLREISSRSSNGWNNCTLRFRFGTGTAALGAAISTQ